MTDPEPHKVDRNERPAFEFWLVFSMLGVLLLLVVAVLFWPIEIPTNQPQGRETVFRDVLEYRTNLLSIIITAFGAWVGAGAAYFFGRENLRVAAEGLLAMREVSPRERLRQTLIKQIPPKTLDWIVKDTTPVKELEVKLLAEPSRWFIPIVKEDGTLITVINEEPVWRFLLQFQNDTNLTNKKVTDVIAYINEKPELSRFKQIHVPVTMDTTVGTANDLMQSKQVYLAIVETEGKPTYFFTTSEVRKLLLQD